MFLCEYIQVRIQCVRACDVSLRNYWRNKLSARNLDFKNQYHAMRMQKPVLSITDLLTLPQKPCGKRGLGGKIRISTLFHGTPTKQRNAPRISTLAILQTYTHPYWMTKKQAYSVKQIRNAQHTLYIY